MSVRLPKILVLSGSFRKASFNTTLATYCSDYLKSKTQVTLLPPSALSSLPLYSQDLETESIPAPALNLKKIVAEHDAFVIASPEYNSSITPALLNALTWLSRPLLGKDEPTYSSFQGKTAALVSASPGGLGGLRAHNHLRDILVAMNCIVVPQIACIGSAFKAFDQHGSLVGKLKA